jgi:hypothetical protein
MNYGGTVASGTGVTNDAESTEGKDDCIKLLQATGRH